MKHNIHHPVSSAKLLWRALPFSCQLLLLLVAAQTAVGVSISVALLSQGCVLPSWGYIPGQEGMHPRCTPEQWQALAAALMAQLCFAAVIWQAVRKENGRQLRAGAAFSTLAALMWLLSIAVVGQPSSLGSRIGWGLPATVAITALQVLLIYLSYYHMGWRQHSWLSCDLRRPHAAEQQKLQRALHCYNTLSTSCTYILLLGLLNALVLVLTALPAQHTAGGSAGNEAAAVQTASTGVLVSMGLTLLPLLWLALTRWAVQQGSRQGSWCSRHRSTVALVASTTIALAELFPALQLFFVFSPAYPWPQELPVRLLLLAAPMGVWMVLLPLTWSAFRAVMALLGQPWAQEAAGQGDCTVLAAAGELQPPEVLQPLMKGAWLLKSNTAATSGRNLAVSKNMSQLSLAAIPSSDSSSMAAGIGNHHRKHSMWQAILQACGSRQHYRYFQLSLDCTTLRWSWNKYCLLYLVESLSYDESALQATLHCVLEPDLQLTFADAAQWKQWLTGLQAAHSLVTGVMPDNHASTQAHAGQTGMQVAPLLQPAPEVLQSSPAAGLPLNPADAAAAADLEGVQSVPASVPVAAHPDLYTSNSLQSLDLLQHTLVRAALYSQQGLQLQQAGVSGRPAGLPTRGRHLSSQRALQGCLHGSRRPSVLDPSALQLQQAQAMAQQVQEAACSAGVKAAAALEQMHAATHALPSASITEQQQLHVQGMPASQKESTRVHAGAVNKPSSPAQNLLGSFRIPAGLRADLLPPLAACGQLAVGGIGSSSGTDSGGGSNAAASEQHPPMHSVLNAGYSMSPLSSSTRHQQHQLWSAAAQCVHAHLPSSKQRQLLQWLQQQGSTGCPESEGPLTSPCYSLESGQLLPVGSVGVTPRAHSMLLPMLLQQQHSNSTSGSSAARACPASGTAAPAAHSPEDPQLASAALQSPSGAAAPWAMQLQRSSQHGSKHWARSPLAAACLHPCTEQLGATHRLGISRSLSSPDLRAAYYCGPPTGLSAAHAAGQVCADCALEQVHLSGWDKGKNPPGEQDAPSAGCMQASGSEPNTSGDSNAYQQVCITGLQQASCCQGSLQHHQAVPLGAASTQRLANATAAAVPAEDVSSDSEAAFAQQEGQPGPQQQWGASILSAISSMARRTRNRTVSFAGQHISGVVDSGANSAAAGGQPASDGQPAATAAVDEGQADVIGSLRSFTTSFMRANSMPQAAGAGSGASFNSGRSFSSRPSFGQLRNTSAAWRGSFAARSTWSDWDDPFSMSQGTLDNSVSASSGVAPAPAADGAITEQQLSHQQQQGWRQGPNKGTAPGLTPVLSANSEDLNRLAGQEQLEQNMQQQHQQQHLEDISMQAAYQLAMRPSAGSIRQLLHGPAVQAPTLPDSKNAAAMVNAADKQGRCPASEKSSNHMPACSQPWLIPTAPAPSSAASGAAEHDKQDSKRPAGAHAAAAGLAAPSLHVLIPGTSAARPPYLSVQDGVPGNYDGTNALRQAPWLLQEQHAELPADALNGMRHSASAPNLQQDASYVVKSPTPSQVSLHSHFSQTSSIGSHWWFEKASATCGGSPTAATAAAAALLAAAAVSATDKAAAVEPSAACKEKQGFSLGEAASIPQVHASTARLGCADSADSQAVNTGFSFPEAVPLFSSGRPVSSAQHVGSGAGAVKGTGKLSSLGDMKKGQMPQVRVDIIPWGKLKLGRRLGSGAEGTVREARYLDAPMAIKDGASSSEIDMFLAAGVHDNLVGLRGLTQKDDGAWCLVLELCSRGTLDMLIHHHRSPLPRPSSPKPRPQTEALIAAGIVNPPEQPKHAALARPDVVKLLALMRGVARGILHLHTRSPAILHRDIKPANIFVGNGMQMKIGDLGMARHVLPPPPTSSRTSSRSASPARLLLAAHCSPRGSTAGALGVSSGPGTPKAPAARTFTPGVVGTIRYTAPEVLGLLDEPQQQPSVETMLKADVYSFGITLWECVERQRPWQDLDDMQVWATWISDPSQATLPPIHVDTMTGAGERGILSELQGLIQECTLLDAQQRPSMEAVLDRIRHLQELYEALRMEGQAATDAAGLAAKSSSTAVH